MKHVIPAAVALGLIAGGPAQAQTAMPGAAVPGTTMPSNTAPTASPSGTSGSGALGTVTGAGTAATGQISNSPAPAAVTTTAEPSRTTSAPVAGANSFTEGQARARIEEKGFGQVTELRKDDQGIWRAKAMKDGKPTAVSLDYQGNIVGQ